MSAKARLKQSQLRSPAQAKPGAQRSGKASLKRRFWVSTLLFLILLFLILLVSSWWGAGGWLEQAWHTLQQREGFVVKGILVEGREHASQELILEKVGVQAGDPISSAKIEEIYRGLKEVPWIKEVTLERRLPDHLILRLQERKPFALWQREGKRYLLGDDGQVIPVKSLEPFRDLPHLVGVGVEAHAQHLLKLLQEMPEIKAQLKSAVRVSNRRWDLYLQNGAKIQLPEKNIEIALHKALEIFKKAPQKNNKTIKQMDLRLSDRAILQYDTSKIK